MKKLLTILLILISISAMSQIRPPIVTNELQTNILKWDDLLMYRDSLIYFRPINATSFQVKRPSSSVWSTYDFTEIPDSFYIQDLDIWVIVNQPITQGDSTFYVRGKPGCLNCWQYSYDNGFWYNWFCSETGASNLSIDYNADDILGIHYNSGLGAYTDSLYFRAIEADSGKVPTIQGDSVVWKPIPKDSMFFIAIPDSQFVANGDTIDLMWQKDTIENDFNTFGISYSGGNVGIGFSGAPRGEKLGVFTDETDEYGLFANSQNGVGIYAEGDIGGKFYSDSGNALEARSTGNESWDLLCPESGIFASQLKVGDGATLTRSGTIASKDIWTGTAAEFAANTAKDGITPQASTTIAFILD